MSFFYSIKRFRTVAMSCAVMSCAGLNCAELGCAELSCAESTYNPVSHKRFSAYATKPPN